MKRIISLVLVLVTAMSLVACGGGSGNINKEEKTIEMQSEEALSVLEVKFSGINNVEYPDLSGWKGYTSTIYDVYVTFDVKVKDEYTNDYKLDKVLSYEIDQKKAKNWGSITNCYEDVNFDKDNFKLTYVLTGNFGDGKYGEYYCNLFKRPGYNSKQKYNSIPEPNQLAEDLMNSQDFLTNMNTRKIEKIFKSMHISLICVK